MILKFCILCSFVFANALLRNPSSNMNPNDDIIMKNQNDLTPTSNTKSSSIGTQIPYSPFSQSLQMFIEQFKQIKEQDQRIPLDLTELGLSKWNLYLDFLGKLKGVYLEEASTINYSVCVNKNTALALLEVLDKLLDLLSTNQETEYNLEKLNHIKSALSMISNFTLIMESAIDAAHSSNELILKLGINEIRALLSLNEEFKYQFFEDEVASKDFDMDNFVKGIWQRSKEFQKNLFIRYKYNPSISDMRNFLTSYLKTGYLLTHDSTKMRKEAKVVLENYKNYQSTQEFLKYQRKNKIQK